MRHQLTNAAVLGAKHIPRGPFPPNGEPLKQDFFKAEIAHGLYFLLLRMYGR